MVLFFPQPIDQVLWKTRSMLNYQVLFLTHFSGQIMFQPLVRSWVCLACQDLFQEIGSIRKKKKLPGCQTTQIIGWILSFFLVAVPMVVDVGSYCDHFHWSMLVNITMSVGWMSQHCDSLSTDPLCLRPLAAASRPCGKDTCGSFDGAVLGSVVLIWMGFG